MGEMGNEKICDYEGSTYQTDFWDRGGREYEDAAEAIALRRLLPRSGRLLLEAGAGAGRNTPRYHGFDRIVLLDYSVTQLKQAQARLGRSERYVYVAADVYHLPFVPGLFDAATMIRVIHHLADAPAAIAGIEQALAPGAAFILEYASKLHLKSIARYLLRRQDWSPFAPEPVEFVELNYNFHPASIRRWLASTGLQLRRQLTVSHFRIGLLKRLVPTRLLAAADGLASLTGDWWQLSPSVFTLSTAGAQKAPAPEGAFFRCPDCLETNFERRPEGLACTGCGRLWRIEDGIHIFK
jgi:ubiquinone/menaquinone biosynthesis C-methylase UbiE